MLTRATLLVGGLALLSGACSNKVSHAPPPLNKDLLAGKWKSSSDALFVAGYEFDPDGRFSTNFRGMEKPVTGRYSWNGDRSIELKYQLTEEVRKAYQAAVKAYKDDVQDRIKTGKLPGQAGPSILSGVREELPAEETLRVGLSDQPRLLMLTPEGSSTLNFEKAE